MLAPQITGSDVLCFQDIAYLQPYIEEIEREIAERAEFDSMTKSK